MEYAVLSMDTDVISALHDWSGSPNLKPPLSADASALALAHGNADLAFHCFTGLNFPVSQYHHYVMSELNLSQDYHLFLSLWGHLLGHPEVKVPSFAAILAQRNHSWNLMERQLTSLTIQGEAIPEEMIVYCFKMINARNVTPENPQQAIDWVWWWCLRILLQRGATVTGTHVDLLTDPYDVECYLHLSIEYSLPFVYSAFARLGAVQAARLAQMLIYKRFDLPAEVMARLPRHSQQALVERQLLVGNVPCECTLADMTPTEIIELHRYGYSKDAQVPESLALHLTTPDDCLELASIQLLYGRNVTPHQVRLMTPEARADHLSNEISSKPPSPALVRGLPVDTLFEIACDLYPTATPSAIITKLTLSQKLKLIDRDIHTYGRAPSATIVAACPPSERALLMDTLADHKIELPFELRRLLTPPELLRHFARQYSVPRDIVRFSSCCFDILADVRDYYTGFTFQERTWCGGRGGGEREWRRWRVESRSR